jgi:hypothetical protein
MKVLQEKGLLNSNVSFFFGSLALPVEKRLSNRRSSTVTRTLLHAGLVGFYAAACAAGLVSSTACSLGLSATSQQYFSLRTNQPPTISRQYFSLRTNQHQPSATSQTNSLWNLIFNTLNCSNPFIIIWMVAQLLTLVGDRNINDRGLLTDQVCLMVYACITFFCGNMHALQPREATSALALYHEGPAGKGFSE